MSLVRVLMLVTVKKGFIFFIDTERIFFIISRINYGHINDIKCKNNYNNTGL